MKQADDGDDRFFFARTLAPFATPQRPAPHRTGRSLGGRAYCCRHRLCLAEHDNDDDDDCYYYNRPFPVVCSANTLS